MNEVVTTQSNVEWETIYHHEIQSLEVGRSILDYNVKDPNKDKWYKEIMGCSNALDRLKFYVENVLETKLEKVARWGNLQFIGKENPEPFFTMEYYDIGEKIESVVFGCSVIATEYIRKFGLVAVAHINSQSHQYYNKKERFEAEKRAFSAYKCLMDAIKE